MAPGSSQWYTHALIIWFYTKIFWTSVSGAPFATSSKIWCGVILFFWFIILSLFSGIVLLFHYLQCLTLSLSLSLSHMISIKLTYLSVKTTPNKKDIDACINGRKKSNALWLLLIFYFGNHHLSVKRTISQPLLYVSIIITQFISIITMLHLLILLQNLLSL